MDAFAAEILPRNSAVLSCRAYSHVWPYVELLKVALLCRSPQAVLDCGGGETGEGKGESSTHQG